jgi:alanine racemase
MGQLEALDTHAGTYPAPWVWLRFAGDIGMTGFSAIEYVAAYARAKAMVHQGRIAGIGHLNQHGRADCVDGIAEADACFRALVETLPGPRTTSNSATVLVHGAHAAATDWIRPGLALYGASPLPGRDGAALGLRPAMSLHSRIVGVRTLAAGEPLGYGGAYTARAPMRIGMIGTGYADGYPRQAPAGTPTLIDGYPAPLLGVVTMDLMAVDITHLPQAGVGAPVALWGVPGLPVEAVASAVGTIAADLLTGLTARVPFFN